MRTIKDLFKSGRTQSYKKGQVLMHQGDPLTHEYYLLKGFVKIYEITDDGDERILMIMGKDDSFPLTTALFRDNYSLRFFYEAMSDVRAQIIEREKFVNQLDGNYEQLQLILEYITKSNRLLIERLSIIESKNAESKILQLLPFLIEKCGQTKNDGKVELKLKITHQDIANMTGLTRETTSIQIKNLEKQHVISQNNDTLTIDSNKLG